MLISQATVALFKRRPDVYIRYRELFMLLNALLHNNVNVNMSECAAAVCAAV